MNIAIVFPKLRGYFERVEYWDNTNRGEVEMIEIGQIISLLEARGHHVHLVMENNKQSMDLATLMKEIQFDFILFYPDYSSIINVAKKVRHVKKNYSSIKVAIFGYYTLLNYEKVMQIMSNIDIGIISIDETPVIEIVDKLEKGEEWVDIPGTVYYEDKKLVVHEPDTQYKMQFHDMPWPKRYIANQKTVEIITISGCYGSCVFCENATARKKIGFRDVRFRDVESVIAEVQYLVKERGVETIHIQDDSFFLQQPERHRWIEEFCRLLKEENITISFVAHARVVDLIKFRYLLPKLKEIGLFRILIGVENFVDERLSFFHKGSTAEQNKTAIQLLEQEGIEIGIGFLMFDPFTTIQNIKTNLQILQENKFYRHFLGVASYYPFPVDSVIGLVPDSELFEMTEKQGLINHRRWFGYDFQSQEVELYYKICEKWAESSDKINGEICRINTYSNEDKRSVIANQIKDINFTRLIQLADQISQHGEAYDYDGYISDWEEEKQGLYEQYKSESYV